MEDKNVLGHLQHCYVHVLPCGFQLDEIESSEMSGTNYHYEHMCFVGPLKGFYGSSERFYCYYVSLSS